MTGWKTNKGTGKKFQSRGKGIDANTFHSVKNQDKTRGNNGVILGKEFDAGHETFYPVKDIVVKPEIDGKEIPSRLIVRIIDMPEAVGSDWKEDKPYVGELLLVPEPKAISKKKLHSVFQSLGIDNESEWIKSEHALYDLADYGLCIRIGEDQLGKNTKELAKRVSKDAQAQAMLIGFWLDRPVNRIGQTGWDWLRDFTS